VAFGRRPGVAIAKASTKIGTCLWTVFNAAGVTVLSVSVMMALLTGIVVGVPERTPEGLRLIPAGRFVADHTYAAPPVPPKPLNVYEYGTLSVAFGRRPEIWSGEMFTVKSRSTKLVASETRILVVNTPDVVATPSNPPVPFGSTKKLVGSGAPSCTRNPGGAVESGATA